MAGNPHPERLLNMPAMRPRPVDPSARGTSFELNALYVNINRNTAFHSFFRNLFQRRIAPETTGHLFQRIRFQGQRFENLTKLKADMVGLYHNEMPLRGQVGKLSLSGEDDSSLCSGFPEKVRIRIPPLIKCVVTENPKPLRQCSQIAIGGKSDIQVSLRAGNVAV